MKTTILRVLLAIAFLTASRFAGASQIIDWIGSYHDDASPWVVTVREDKQPDFAYSTKGVSTSISPSAWLPHKGWFVLIQDDFHLWAFDGVDQLLLWEIAKKGNTLYGLHSLPALPPEDVLDYLPKSFREIVQGKFKKTVTPVPNGD